MKLAELKISLNQYSKANVRFVLPDGSQVPAHAHVTEVARIDKKFVDCGGTFRTDSWCRLQTWFADEVDHRLSAGKLVKILEKADSFLGPDDLEVDVEHEVACISQFPLESVESSPEGVVLHLGQRHTACLALDKCKPPATSAFNPMKFTFKEEKSGCCSEEQDSCCS